MSEFTESSGLTFSVLSGVFDGEDVACAVR